MKYKPGVRVRKIADIRDLDTIPIGTIGFVRESKPYSSYTYIVWTNNSAIHGYTEQELDTITEIVQPIDPLSYLDIYD